MALNRTASEVSDQKSQILNVVINIELQKT